jgi:mRNA interferase MazF
MTRSETTEASLSRGDVVVCALPGDFGKPRPALVVQSDLFNQTHASVVICPISSEVTGLSLFRVTIEPSEASGLRTDSEVMVDKITAVKRTRIRQRIGHVSRARMQLIDAALRTWLGLPDES